MKKAKARILTFDLECPHCGEFLINSYEGGGSMTFVMNEQCPEEITCLYCDKPSKVPDRVKGEKIGIARGTKWV